MQYICVRGGTVKSDSAMTKEQKNNLRWVPITPQMATLPHGVLLKTARHIRRGTRYIPKV